MRFRYARMLDTGFATWNVEADAVQLRETDLRLWTSTALTIHKIYFLGGYRATLMFARLKDCSACSRAHGSEPSSSDKE